MLTRNKRGGFKTFVRRRDGKSPVSEVKPIGGVSMVKIDQLDSLLKVLQGEYGELLSSFFWSSSPQGVAYWNLKDLGINPLTPEDYQWLQELYDYHSLQGGVYANR